MEKNEINQDKNVDSKIIWTILPGESKIKYVLRILKQIKWLGIIAIFIGIPSAIIATNQIIDGCKDKEIEELKTSINNNNQIIKDTFNPDEISLQNDTLGELALIKAFQEKSIEYSDLIQSLLSADLSVIPTNDINKYKTIMISHVERMKYMIKLDISLRFYISDLDTLADIYNFEEYNLIDKSKDESYEKSLHEYNKWAENEHDKAITYFNNKELEKSIEHVKEWTSGKRALRYYKSELELIVDFNRIIEKRLKQYNNKN